MRPGTCHFVITLEHCLALGGHFYNRDNYVTTLHSLIDEHYFGKWITNTAHPTSLIILFKTLCRYKTILEDKNHDLLASKFINLFQFELN